MKNWRTNLGGALGALGSTLVGVGVVPQLSGTPSNSALGKFFTALFAADSKAVNAAHEETKIMVADLQNQISQVKGDSATIPNPASKPIDPTPNKP